ncbi:MAG TPA: hypothetical protein DHV01_16870 [Rhodoferax sp.]|nr:hypothetical protein [Rhodoferax sp.]
MAVERTDGGHLTPVATQSARNTKIWLLKGSPRRRGEGLGEWVFKKQNPKTKKAGIQCRLSGDEQKA